MADYIPLSKEHKNAEEYNQNLPGAGGVFNSRNLQTYHYAGNNPIKYTDPTGKYSWYHQSKEMRQRNEEFLRSEVERQIAMNPGYRVQYIAKLRK
ncbi:hypothetical protein PVA45_05965 [Entomospira entomophila]|uniref:RHS repeat-associated core domain-containing protein n=1 Tax=Entomospira entomophila TaxID=2719988 RepID=A0A968GEM4_9SPIO|nr:hypothetical protein [Entomospira entomophilus]NIZ41044.1 hypothetical protein [Entomospira entomophilus]WDI35253.1 hypothetical protein PVA45_05965 [Entomospira entomophilus]